jgi:hypothetical protein
VVTGVVAAGVLAVAGAGGSAGSSAADLVVSSSATVQEEIPKPTQDAYVRWYDDVEHDYTALIRHLGDVATTAGAGDVSGLGAACGAALTDVNHLQAKEAFPGNPRLWDAALSDLEHAFIHCVAGDYVSATAYLEAGSVKFTQLSADLDAEISGYSAKPVPSALGR